MGGEVDRGNVPSTADRAWIGVRGEWWRRNGCAGEWFQQA